MASKGYRPKWVVKAYGRGEGEESKFYVEYEDALLQVRRLNDEKKSSMVTLTRVRG